MEHAYHNPFGNTAASTQNQDISKLGNKEIFSSAMQYYAGRPAQQQRNLLTGRMRNAYNEFVLEHARARSCTRNSFKCKTI